MICNHCGKENQSSSKFCIYCGTSFSASESASESVFKVEKTNILTAEGKEQELLEMVRHTIYLLCEVSAAPQIATIDIISDLTKHSAEMIEDLFRQHRADLRINKRLVAERKALDTMLEQHGVSITDAETFKKKKEKEEAIKKAVRAKTKEVCQNVVEELELLYEFPDEQVAATATNAKKLIELLQEMIVVNSIRIKRNQERKDVIDALDKLRVEKETLLLENADNAGRKQRIEEIEEFLDARASGVDEFDEGMVRRLIKSIMVDDDKIEVIFKAGLKVCVKI